MKHFIYSYSYKIEVIFFKVVVLCLLMLHNVNSMCVTVIFMDCVTIVIQKQKLSYQGKIHKKNYPTK